MKFPRECKELMDILAIPYLETSEWVSDGYDGEEEVLNELPYLKVEKVHYGKLLQFFSMYVDVRRLNEDFGTTLISSNLILN